MSEAVDLSIGHRSRCHGVSPARGPGPRGTRSGKFSRSLMKRKDLETWLDNISVMFLSLMDLQKSETLDHLISLSGAVQPRHLSKNPETLLKREALKVLPLELGFYLLERLDPRLHSHAASSLSSGIR